MTSRLRRGSEASIGGFILSTRTAMSNPYLPPEMLDHIVDLLHKDSEALTQCCPVSKSWIPRTRKHLFADVRFHEIEDVQSWKKIFPDPTNSPAYYTKTLYIGPHIVADPEVDGWIREFSRVEQLEVRSPGQRLFPPRVVFSCPVPWIFTRHQISPRGLRGPPAPVYF